MYFLIRPILFLLDPERVHHLVVSILKATLKIPFAKFIFRSLYYVDDPNLVRTVLGIRFPNPVGLAAGFDKDALLVDELANLGFGFVEVGTVTPKPQLGNDKPRLFRLPKDKALINRMGFNNQGVAKMVERLSKSRSGMVVGGNIGKNKMTPNAHAIDDYKYCIEQLYPHVHYFVLNVSSPNTPGLRELQEKDPLRQLLIEVKRLASEKPIYRPIFLKIAPDLTDSQLEDIIEIVKETGTEGLIATNTTIGRTGLKSSDEVLKGIGAGGLSGLPLRERALEVLRFLRQRLGPDFPIISVGGIMSEEDAIIRLEAGADLVQVYTGFIYEGPSIVRRINRKWRRKLSTR